MWLSYFRFNPALKDHINFSQANIAYTIAAGNRGRGQKLIPLNEFLLDYKAAFKTDNEKMEDQIRSFFIKKVKKEKNG
tara:strand:+ start:319 stop:552 length:234 start_codon:yes stop_codon:yes gene_type:complete